MSEEQTTEKTAGAAGRARPSDGLSLADLRDAVRLRQDLARLEDENRFLREQLAHATAGWRDEQRRAQGPSPAPQSPPAPASDAEPQAEAPTDSAPPAPPRPVDAPVPPAGSSGLWSRLWQSLSD